MWKEGTDEEADTIIENMIAVNNAFSRAQTVSSRCMLATTIGISMMLKEASPIFEEYRKTMGNEVYNDIKASIRGHLKELMEHLREPDE